MKRTLVWVITVVALVGALAYFGYPYIRNTEPEKIEEVVAQDGTYEWCVDKGGEPYSHGPDSLKWCVYESKVFRERCLVNGDYLVTSSTTGTSSILVKYKKSPGEMLPCEYSVRLGDYVIQEEATYLIGLVGRYVVVDSGTGPSGRDLILYDALNRRKAYTNEYSLPLSISETGIEYWTPTTISPNKENCPEFDVLNSYGGRVVMERRVRLNPADLSLTDLGEKRCQYSS